MSQPQLANNARAQHQILVVEDDARVSYEICTGLREAGFSVDARRDGTSGLEAILKGEHALVVLDLGLPERDGVEILETLAGRSSTPVIVLTARTEVETRVQCFQLGAIDYLPKPFFVRELVARIDARLQVEQRVRREKRFGQAVVDLDARSVEVAGATVELTAHEFNVLAALVERPGRALTRAFIAEHALPESGERSDRTVDSHISRIRSKLGKVSGPAVATVWGVGYRFDESKVKAGA